MSEPRSGRLSLVGNTITLLALALFAGILARWQAGDWWIATPRAGRWLAAGGVVLAYVALCIPLARRARGTSPSAGTAGDADAWLVAWASQTGFAREIADHTAAALRATGACVHVRPLHEVDVDALRRHRHALFIASTTGEGDPPDHALAFTRAVLAGDARLDGLGYAVLALGDSGYARFCAFGRTLDAWLRQAGARPLFDRIDVDAGDAGALRHWQHSLARLVDGADMPDWSPPAYRPWRLRTRRLLNPGSPGGPAFHLELTPDSPGDLDWDAGDIAEIGPRHDAGEVAAWLAAARLDGSAIVESAGVPTPLGALLARSRLPDPHTVRGLAPQAVADAMQPLPHREYSIASLPADGALHLLVRLRERPDGRPGLGSGWLTGHAGIGGAVDLRIRRNPGFRPPPDARPMVLIGNGTGMAGLRALLKARIAAGHRRNWLLFGERTRAHDLFHGDELDAWRRDGWLEHLDLAFSRDTPGCYVQHLLAGQATRLRDWVADGAAVYVCGSLEGMAPAVDAVLRDLLGAATLHTMAADGRYRRDVY